MKTQYLNYCTLQYYTSVVQQQFRALRAMKVARKNYQELREATLKIQRIFRGKLERKKYLEEKWRAMMAMRSNKSQYQKLKKVTINIKSLFRANQAIKFNDMSFWPKNQRQF
jgi:abnormal spindle-like microcephaly-associated protein